MENKKQSQWLDVKEIKFHHKMKRFYHINTFRKGYTMIIIWLLLANIFSIFKYKTFASSYVYTNWVENNNAWWWWEDTAANWYDSWNPRSERQWPCSEWWHVPSRWEWQDIVTARCHYRSDCSDSDLTNIDSYWNLHYISKNLRWKAFRSDFGMDSYNYWSSSPYYVDNGSAWNLNMMDTYIALDYYARDYDYYSVRCLKDTFDDIYWYWSSTSSLTTSPEWYIISDNGKSYILALNDLNGYYYRWANENTANTSWGYWGLYWYGYEPSPCYYYDINWNPQEVSDGSYMELFSSNLVLSGYTCSNYRYNFTCEDWTFKLGWNSEYSPLYDYCEREWRNTAELTTTDSGDYQLRYSWKQYTIASIDLDGTYYRWFNENIDNSQWISTRWVWTYTGTILFGNTYWVNNVWWWSGDTVANWYDSWNPRSERQWPCEEWWHVPSRWEWQDIFTARCHYRTDCSDNYLHLDSSEAAQYMSYKAGAFKSDFRFGSSRYYWSSSPVSDTDFWALRFYDNTVYFSRNRSRNSTVRIRCLKNSIDDANPSTSSLTTTSEGYVLTADGKSYTLALNDLDSYYYRWFNENRDYSKWVSTIWIWTYTGTILYGNTYQVNNAWWWSNDRATNWYDSWNPRSERQWPCEEWWHVPSRWEWQDIVTARCHLSSNNCNDSDLIDVYDDYGNLNEIKNKNWLLTTFKSDFGISSNTYWSSTPYNGYSTDSSSILHVDYYFTMESYTNRNSQYSHVRCIKDSVDYEENEPEIGDLIIPTTENYEINVWWNTYDELPSNMTVTINNVQQVENEPVLWEISINFWWNNAIFTELMQIKIPVEWATRAVVKVKHAWSDEYNFDWLTINANANCDNWIPTSNQYNWEAITVVDWFVSIYTCGASSFIALDANWWDWLITVNIAALNSWQNVCSWEDYIFPNITALPTAQTISLAKKFSCVFWNAAAKAVTLHLLWDLTDWNGNMIPWANVKLANPEWAATPTVLKDGTTIFSSTWFMWLWQTLFNKVGNKVWEAYWSGVEIEVTIPAWTPDGIYNGTIVLDF